ncbi:phenylacetaldoxime dehydratase family protein [Bordetella hinzii]|uniref:phenylacetaldoxime dehydratase family protein n=1 Tax=Bordetella hinzii TaxID=103855 RepID=UPI001150AEBA|nr:phenylacetaldoxime dehydratase family protein [Bordetella hinzii]QDJ50509.1 phenylacetaldoxime dehydratase [Bordetella hinzii]
MTFDVQYPRVIAARRPQGHQPAAPRFSLRWEKPVAMLTTAYFGIQAEALRWEDEQAFHRLMQPWLDDPYGPESYEFMRCLDEAGHTNGIIVAYWTDPAQYATWMRQTGFRAWFTDAARLRERFGYWNETVSVPYDRHETIYSKPTYRIGFGRTPQSTIVSITNNGYFGAARDRLPVSAIDELLSPWGTQLPAPAQPASRGARLLARVPHNVAMLRSGQFWEGAGVEQTQDYLQALQPKLMRGMNFLRDHKVATGCMSLRIMANLNEDGSPRQETSVAAYFLSLAHLEGWAASHETHLDIYRHAIDMNRLYKEKREVVTWHELFVLQDGHAFEYVNCHPATGMLPFAELWTPA